MVIYFNSSAKAPYYKLSNFHSLGNNFIVIDGECYNTTEAAFQAFHKIANSDRKHFQIAGKFGSWDGMNAFFDKEIASKKIAYWSKKDNLGIVAKMASNPKYKSKTNLTFKNTCDKYDDILDGYTKDWAILLIHKFSLPGFRELLLETKDEMLVEFDRMGNPNCFWGGKIIEGRLVGSNAMGKMLMMVRESLNLKKQILEVVKR